MRRTLVICAFLGGCSRLTLRVSIPTRVVNRFLEDIAKHGRYTGFVSLGVYWQQIESPHLHNYLKMKDKQTGILVNKCDN